MVCAGVFLLPVAEKGVSLKMAFLQCSLDALPVQEHPCIFAAFFRYSLTWILEKLWYVRVFFCSVL